MNNAFNLGLRVLGGKAARRRIIDHSAAFNAYAQCDPRAALEQESFLSLFTFNHSFKDHFEVNESEAGYNGACAADWLWWDLDQPTTPVLPFAMLGALPESFSKSTEILTMTTCSFSSRVVKVFTSAFRPFGTRAVENVPSNSEGVLSRHRGAGRSPR